MQLMKPRHVTPVLSYMQLAFSEAAESNAGPFTVHARMRSLDDGTLFPHGTGKV